LEVWEIETFGCAKQHAPLSEVGFSRNLDGSRILRGHTGKPVEIYVRYFLGEAACETVATWPQRAVRIPRELVVPRQGLFNSLASKLGCLALLAASCGERNRVVCGCCIRTSQHTMHRGGRAAVPAPFAECRSKAEVENGKCANCIWHGTDCVAAADPYLDSASSITETKKGIQVFY
jgi:hypothetical protein